MKIPEPDALTEAILKMVLQDSTEPPNWKSLILLEPKLFCPEVDPRLFAKACGIAAREFASEGVQAALLMLASLKVKCRLAHIELEEILEEAEHIKEILEQVAPNGHILQVRILQGSLGYLIARYIDTKGEYEKAHNWYRLARSWHDCGDPTGSAIVGFFIALNQMKMCLSSKSDLHAKANMLQVLDRLHTELQRKEQADTHRWWPLATADLILVHLCSHEYVVAYDTFVNHARSLIDATNGKPEWTDWHQFLSAIEALWERNQSEAIDVLKNIAQNSDNRLSSLANLLLARMGWQLTPDQAKLYYQLAYEIKSGYRLPSAVARWERQRPAVEIPPAHSNNN